MVSSDRTVLDGEAAQRTARFPYGGRNALLVQMSKGCFETGGPSACVGLTVRAVACGIQTRILRGLQCSASPPDRRTVADPDAPCDPQRGGSQHWDALRPHLATLRIPVHLISISRFPVLISDTGNSRGSGSPLDETCVPVLIEASLGSARG